ncbi:Hypothetical protein SCLAV_3120 [Streptomyces clavuligerus]|uniref:Uncharacterized protein n=1 Tax=Streptomyces clavuligerus TaxID=1901 RepID=B5GT35_STRCL|nr:hypothetical protein SSCG_02509 [Streptomyces clavuligerus]EFG08191.1 Hypothetical protein SCLAV_3120 [Streptomyces clavuligerus]
MAEFPREPRRPCVRALIGPVYGTCPTPRTGFRPQPVHGFARPAAPGPRRK